jgi:integrase
MGVKIREKVKDSGEWWLFINHRGMRKAVKVGSKQAAKEKAKEIEKALVAGKLDLTPPPPSPLFKDYAEGWMKQHVGMTGKAGTVETYRRILDLHLIPEFGALRLSEITRPEIRAYCAAAKERKLSHSTIGLHLAVLSGIMGMAVDDEKVAVNPCAKMRRTIKGEEDARTADFLTAGEAKTILEAAREHSPRAYPLFLCALRTGMRTGELAALRWDAIDWQGKFIEVRHSSWRGIIGTPKGGKRRRVDMSDQLAAVLHDHKKAMSAESLKAGRPLPEWVFHGKEDGRQLTRQAMRRALDRVTRKCGMRSINPHALRHTFASLLIAAGESLAYVKEQMGHSSISITVDIYGHLVPGTNRAAVNALDDPEWRKSATQAQPAALAAEIPQAIQAYSLVGS